jgi:ABC-type sugar transport system substrate-binding protein/AraC-like DNA-binding protein
MQHEARLHPDISLEIKSAADNTEKQISDIREFIDRKVDLIIVSPNKAAPVTPIVEKAYNAGIPVILVDRKIFSSQYTAFIGADNYKIGEEAGNYMVKLLNGKGNVFEITGLEGSSPSIERHRGFISVLERYPEIHRLSPVDGAWLQEVAENKMDEALAACPAIDAVYAHNDRMAMGAYNAALRHNLANKICFIGIDALPGKNGGIEQVLENRLKATFIYPTNGDKIIQLAAAILHGKPCEKNHTLYTNVVDESNVRVLKHQTDAIIEQENKISFLNSKIDAYLSQYTAQRYLLMTAGLIALLFSCLLLVIYSAYRSKHNLNIELGKRNEEINRNLIENRKQLKELFRQNRLSGDTKETLNDVDNRFLEKLHERIEKNLSNPQLYVEDLGQDMGLSRTQLYRKVKLMTGYSPSELLKIIRLKKAFTLLASSGLSISEIAYETGFTSPSYFAKCFREYYRESPTDYQKRIQKK